MRRLLFFVLIFYSITFFSQYANNWYFGLNCGLNFNLIPPGILSNGTVPSFDNSSTMSDNNGNLLFYSDGVKVWDQNNAQMPNGSGLIGNFTAGACALIMPIPCSNKKYVIFHVTEFSNPGFLNYTVVDMNLNGGLGDVVAGQKNISLGSGWTEKLCAYYNSANNCYWVLAHKWLSDQFVAFRVDMSSIATMSVVSAIGSIHNCGTVGGAHDAMGQLTISPDGSLIVNALTCQDHFEIFNFNQNTGALTNSIVIPGYGTKAWGTAFSPNSQKLYLNSIFGSSIYQYDVSNYNTPAIVNSSVTLYNTGLGGYNFGYMELGPNGKIYIPRPNTNWLSVVNLPDLTAPACNFSFSGQSTGAATAKWGLSRVAYNIPGASSFSLNSATSTLSCGMSNASATIIPSVPGNYTCTWTPGNYSTAVVNNLTVGNYTINVTNGSCITASVTISILPAASVSSNYSYTLNPCNGTFNTTNTSTGCVNYLWDFGDGGTSTLTSPSHTFSPGSYTISLIASSGGCSDTIKKNITVANISLSSFSHTLDVCDSIVKLMNLSVGANSFFWKFGDGTFSNLSNPGTHTYNASGIYTITLISNPGSACADSSNVIVTVSKNPVSSFIIPQNCFKTIETINSSSFASSYLWQFGDGSTSSLSQPNHTYANFGTYTISLTTNPGTSCASTSTKVITITDYPLAGFKFVTSPCSGLVNFTNTSVNSNSYYWSFGNGLHSNVTHPNINFTNGSYVITLITQPNTPCADTSSKRIDITVHQEIADFEYKCLENTFDDVSFVNRSTSSVFSLWDFGDGGTSNAKNPVHNFEFTGKQNICMMSVNEFGCRDTICKEVDVCADWTLYVPNTFTPDENGTNDVFHAYGTNIFKFTMDIYDRWGEKIFGSSDIHNGWDGTFKGKKAKEDVYVWKVQAVDYKGKNHQLVGHVSLIR